MTRPYSAIMPDAPRAFAAFSLPHTSRIVVSHHPGHAVMLEDHRHTDPVRQPDRRPPLPAAWVAIPFALGILAARAMDVAWALPLAMSALLLGCSIALIRTDRRRSAMACLVATSLLLGFARYRTHANEHDAYRDVLPFASRDVELVGRVVTDPRPASRKWVFGIRADTIRSGETLIRGSVPVYAHVDTSLGAPRIGDTVRLRGTMSLPRATTPGAFDYGEHLERLGYAGLLSAWGPGGFRVVEESRGRWVARWDGVRDHVRKALAEGVGGDDAALAGALLIGDRSGLPRDVIGAFQSAGVIHVLAVSGLHVGIVLFAPWWLMRRFFGRAPWQAFALAAIAWLYALLTGMNPPVVRATIMVTVFLFALPAGRIFSSWNALALAGIISLTVAPADLFAPGFQLSYAAMIGIFAAGDLLRARGLDVGNVRNRYLRYALGLSAVTIAAYAAVWPIIAHHFWRISFIGIALSPVMVVLITVGIWCSIATVMFAWIPGGAAVVGFASGAVLRAARAIATAGADLPFASAWVRPPTWIEIAVYCCALVIAIVVVRRRGVPRGAVVGALLMANLWAWSAAAHRRSATEIVFLDVGQGDAVVCAFRNGATILVDAGRRTEWFDAGEWVVAPNLRSRGISRLDAVVATHPDNDHVGGLRTILNDFDVGALYTNGEEDTTATWRSLIVAARERDVPIGNLASGDSIAGLGRDRVIVLAPPRDTLRAALWPENERSVVLRVETPGGGVLLTGDAGHVSEGWMLDRWGSAVRSDVLKLGHHGSRTATSKPFLEAVSPSVALVSAGAGNRFGHPSPEILARLSEQGIDVVRTDLSGTAIWRSESDTSYWVLTLPTPPIPPDDSR